MDWRMDDLFVVFRKLIGGETSLCAHCLDQEDLRIFRQNLTMAPTEYYL
jgi:hypothetical protein